MFSQCFSVLVHRIAIATAIAIALCIVGNKFSRSQMEKAKFLDEKQQTLFTQTFSLCGRNAANELFA